MKIVRWVTSNFFSPRTVFDPDSKRSIKKIFGCQLDNIFTEMFKSLLILCFLWIFYVYMGVRVRG